MDNEAWVRVYSEVYEGCLVGNKEGLLELGRSINLAIQDGEATPDFKSDMESVVCINDSWGAEEELMDDEPLSFWLKLFLFLWLLVLPVLGILGAIMYFVNSF